MHAKKLNAPMLYASKQEGVAMALNITEGTGHLAELVRALVERNRNGGEGCGKETLINKNKHKQREHTHCDWRKHDANKIGFEKNIFEKKFNGNK